MGMLSCLRFTPSLCVERKIGQINARVDCLFLCGARLFCGCVDCLLFSMIPRLLLYLLELILMEDYGDALLLSFVDRLQFMDPFSLLV